MDGDRRGKAERRSGPGGNAAGERRDRLGPAAAPQRRADGQADDREGEQESQEPQVVADAEDARRDAAADHPLEGAGPPSDDVRRPARGRALVRLLDQTLDGREQECADHERHQQPRRALAEERPPAALAEGELHACAGEEEEDREAERREEDLGCADQIVRLGVLHMPVRGIEGAQAVVHEHACDRRDPQPVDPVQATRRRNRRCAVARRGCVQRAP
jgi:hypothetical protein